MNILNTIKTALNSMDLDIETGSYTGDDLNYILLTPLTERSEDVADNKELTETADCYVHLYYVGNYQQIKNQIVTLLKTAGLIIEDRRYVEHDKDTDQYHYVITVEEKEIL